MSHDPRDLDAWLASQTGALHESLDGLLDVDAGLSDAKLSGVHTDMTQALNPVLDVEAGLDSIHPQPARDTASGGIRVLLVESHDMLAEALVLVLTQHGMAVRRLASGHGVLDLVTEVDVILLELTLPDVDGLTLLRQIRKVSDVPVIAVTARGATSDRVQALRSGVDDYLVKPFAILELAARIDVAVRRRTRVHARTGTGLLTFDDITVDIARHEVRVAGELITLNRKEFEVLKALATARGKVLRREQLLAEVWGDAYLSRSTSRSLDVHIATLRTKLGRPGLIETVRGVGYRLAIGPE